MNSFPPRGLGRGLDALIPQAPNGNVPGQHGVTSPSAPPWRSSSAWSAADQRSGVYFDELPVTAIRPNPRQPRTVFDEEAMSELVHSITEVGLLQPVVVRPVTENQYELVMGERRWRACQEAGLATIPAIIRATTDDDLLRDALLENLHRASLNPLEEAAAYAQMLEDFGCTHDELAARLGKSRPQISNSIRLLRLPVAVQRRLAAGVLSAGHARALLAVSDVSTQEALASRVVAEGISVRGLEELVAAGTPSPTTTRTRSPREVDPELAEIAGRLSERLDTRCSAEMNRRRGRLVIEFATPSDLRRITALLGADD
ncbi:MAG TPA: ParB/RepB/Spo0J family partition protein [Nocardioidaceae bacterium]|nr:ParB/RepB/Spo0J family partition protein [Nocardioidaceae bacterium]